MSRTHEMMRETISNMRRSLKITGESQDTNPGYDGFHALEKCSAIADAVEEISEILDDALKHLHERIRRLEDAR